MQPITGFSQSPDLSLSESVSLTQASNGEVNVLYRGMTLYSRFSPSDSAERLSRRAADIENCIYIIPSPLLGYGILSFISRIPESSIAIGLETSQELMALSEDHQRNILHKNSRKNYRCYRTGNSRQLYEVFNSIQTGQYRKCSLVPLNAGYRQNKEKYDGLFSTFQHFMKNYWQNRLTLAKMGPLWIRNLTENLTMLSRPHFTDFQTEKPVVLTGAGESLEETIPLIRENRGLIYILCVDTAVQALIRNGIVPDGIVNLEAQFYNLQDFYSVGARNIDLFSDITAYPATLRPGNFNHYIFTSNFAETALHARLKKQNLLPPEIPPLGSVGVTALFLAGEITKGFVFLTGLDFSYTQGKTHAKETPFHDYCRLRENRLHGDMWYSFSASRSSYPASGKTEGTVTNGILESYGRQLEDLSRSMDNRVYDLGKIGLNLSIPQLNREGFKTKIAETESILKNRGPAENKMAVKDVMGFREDERKRLETLTGAWDQIESGGKKAEEILPLLRECNYLYFHFPDRKELPNTDPAFLFRVIREARILLRRLS